MDSTATQDPTATSQHLPGRPPEVAADPPTPIMSRVGHATHSAPVLLLPAPPAPVSHRCPARHREPLVSPAFTASQKLVEQLTASKLEVPPKVGSPRWEVLRRRHSCGGLVAELQKAEEEAAGDRWTTSKWLSSLSLTGRVAACLNEVAPDADSEDELGRIRKLGRACTAVTLELQLLERQVVKSIVRAIIPELRKLVDSEFADTRELIKNPKYSEATQMALGSTDTYFGGLERIIGGPNPKLRKGMEHVASLWRRR